MGSGNRTFGCTLLIAGCCIGAGMLGLPVLSAAAGFYPSLLAFAASWLFMVVTGLLLLEVNLWFDEEVSFISMAGRTLGRAGQIAGWILFLYLFYTLMVAYSAASGTLVADFFQEATGTPLPQWIGSLVFSILFGSLIYLGTGAVDGFNRILVMGLVVTYVVLIAIGLPNVKRSLLEHVNWPATVLALPAMVISFGYHNLVPSLKTYLKGDVRNLTIAIVVGSLIPLVIYLAWEMLILGIVPAENFRDSANRGEIATQSLIRVVGSSWVGVLAEYFAFFSIVTSFLAVALSLVDFLADGLSIKKTAGGRFFLCLLTMVPPFLCALSYPMIFDKALSYAGAFGAVILFGIIPTLMVWFGRYRENIQKQRIVPGGKFTLVAVLAFSLFVVGMQIFVELKKWFII